MSEYESYIEEDLVTPEAEAPLVEPVVSDARSHVREKLRHSTHPLYLEDIELSFDEKSRIDLIVKYYRDYLSAPVSLNHINRERQKQRQNATRFAIRMIEGDAALMSRITALFTYGVQFGVLFRQVKQSLSN